jgi:hypothetical protein
MSISNFDFEILDAVSTEEELNRKHREYIKKNNSLEPHGYNVAEDLKKEK